MNNLDVRLKIEKIFERENDYDFIYVSGDGDCADIFAVKFIGDTYVDGYECQINITLNFSSMMWDVDVNGFNALTEVSDETNLAFAIKQQIKFSRVPCAEQILAESQIEQPDEFYY